MKKSFFLLALIFCSVQILMCQTSKTVNVVTPGTLSTLLTSGEKATITDLTVTGSIDSADLVTMKNMSQLAHIDLSGSSVSGNRIPTKVFTFSFQIHSVILPSTVTEIGSEAFSLCMNMTDIVLPQNLKKIEAGAFLYCQNLNYIILPDQLESIDYNAFSICRKLQNIKFPNSLQHIGSNVFLMTQIDSFHIPASVTSIDAAAFETDSVSYISADSLNINYSTNEGVLFNKDKSELIFYPRYKPETQYVIPSSVITMNSFMSCLNLVTVYMPASVIEINDNQPFMNCNNLSELTVSDDNPKFKSINNVLFSKDLTQLIRYAPDQNGTRYIIPQQVKKIIDYAFSSAKKLERIEFSNSIDTIGNYGFYNCVKLDSVVFPESLREIETGAFSSCVNLSELKYPAGVDSVGVDITVSCVEMDAMTISSSVSFFNYTNFNRCSDLDSIKLNAHTPPAVGTFNFNLIDTITATLYVPQGAMQVYAADPFWGAFTIAEFQFFLNTSGVSGSMNDVGGNGEFDVVSNTEWTITTDQNWVHINNVKGMDNDKVTFIVDANPGSDRQAIITINGYDLEPLFITVNQAGIETSTNGTVDDKQIKVYVLGSQLIVKNAKDQVVTLYSITGASILSQKASSDYEELNISKFPSGVYLVKAGDRKVKIIF